RTEPARAVLVRNRGTPYQPKKGGHKAAPFFFSFEFLIADAKPEFARRTWAPHGAQRWVAARRAAGHGALVLPRNCFLRKAPLLSRPGDLLLPDQVQRRPIVPSPRAASLGPPHGERVSDHCRVSVGGFLSAQPCFLLPYFLCRAALRLCFSLRGGRVWRLRLAALLEIPSVDRSDRSGFVRLLRHHGVADQFAESLSERGLAAMDPFFLGSRDFDPAYPRHNHFRSRSPLPAACRIAGNLSAFDRPACARYAAPLARKGNSESVPCRGDSVGRECRHSRTRHGAAVADGRARHAIPARSGNPHGRSARLVFATLELDRAAPADARSRRFAFRRRSTAAHRRSAVSAEPLHR